MSIIEKQNYKKDPIKARSTNNSMVRTKQLKELEETTNSKERLNLKDMLENFNAENDYR
jgi:hypothetical protein